MDLKTFKASQTYKGYPLPQYVDYQALLLPVNHALSFASCTTVRRSAGWLAQVGAECGSFRWGEELADGSAYEGRSDLGNTRPGDGRRFKGGGPIQLTGRHNYTRFSKWAYKNRARIKREFGLTITSKTMFVDRPQLVQNNWAYGLLAADWYWTKARNMNSYCDRNDIVGMTYAINGGYNNLSGRTKRWHKAKSLGDAVKPTSLVINPKPVKKPAKPKPPKKPVVTRPVPKPATPKYVLYTIKDGDTLAKIAARLNKHGRHGVTWQQLRKINGLKNADLIHVGDTLRVPRKALT